MKDDRLYLIHISECIERIENYLSDTDIQGFIESDLLQDAVIRNLQVLSESTQKISDATKESQPEVPWNKIAGFRNILVHGYLGIDSEKVWEIIVQDLPQLKQAIKDMLG